FTSIQPPSSALQRRIDFVVHRVDFTDLVILLGCECDSALTSNHTGAPRPAELAALKIKWTTDLPAGLSRLPADSPSATRFNGWIPEPAFCRCLRRLQPDLSSCL